MTTTLERLVRQHGEFRDAARALRTLGDVLRELEPALPPDVPSRAAASARLAEGIPALVDEPLLDGQTLLGNAELLARHLAAAGLSAAVDAFEALARFSASGDAVARMALSGEWDALPTGAPADGIATLADYAARPVLRAAARSVEPEIAAANWRRRCCPACGARPLLSELRPAGSDEASRVLRCGRCASAWGYPRLACPGCGSRDHKALGYLHVDGEQDFRRAERCDECRSYIKSIAVLSALDASALLEEDLATSMLDLIATERGYHR